MSRIARVSLGLLVAMVTLAAAARPAEASLLTGHEAQLASWLGQGELDFFPLYEKQSGDTAWDFHNKVDDAGATFTLLEAIIQGRTYVIGGYNPQDWHSGGIFNATSADTSRTAFIYSLTTGAVQAQRTTSDDPLWGGYGELQTYNHADYGPTFGGSDLLLTGLDTGTAVQLSYGTSDCGLGGKNILGTTYLTPSCDSFTNEPYDFVVGALEVYTFATAEAENVPDTSATVMLLGMGVLGLAAGRRFLPAQS